MKSEWTWERVYNFRRRLYGGYPADAGVKMQCERLAAKVSKGIQLTKHDIYYLERLEKKAIEEDEKHSNEHDIRDESNYLGFDNGGEG